MNHQQNRLLLRLIVCVYVLYLAWDALRLQMEGGSAMPDALAYGACAVLVLGALLLGGHTLIQYRNVRRGGHKEKADPRDSEADTKD